MARLFALGMAVLIHSVLGISYYHYYREASASASLLGAWFFSACVVALLQAIKIFPTGAPAPNPIGQRFRGGGRPHQTSPSSSSWSDLLLETGICCLVLDVTLTQLWHRVESLCQCAITGVLQALAVEEPTFLACEYWTLTLTTGLIGGSLLWLTLQAMSLPSNVLCCLIDMRCFLNRCWSALFFGPAPHPHQTSNPQLIAQSIVA
ncbi:uncharacterized protein [Drosophila kikkawai]|uniref:Uncharacterized protein n=1 Tax=Drosophila kikkawai TaxID=30033 RepID=A0A6P4J7J6_DROKI|nr:uncharacterized protein LOC108080969 [Drosophila kikkawai]KAH8347262.1 hypothetical protein KR059_007347 [Drosophila kikkawai]